MFIKTLPRRDGLPNLDGCNFGLARLPFVGLGTNWNGLATKERLSSQGLPLSTFPRARGLLPVSPTSLP